MKHGILSCAAAERNRWCVGAESLKHEDHEGHEEKRFWYFT